RAAGGPRGRPDQAGVLPHVQALVRDASPRGWLRHPDRPGTAGTPRRRTTMIYTHVLNRGAGGCALDAAWVGGGGGRAGAEAGGTYRGIPCRGSQANAPGAGAVESGEATGMTRRSTRIGLGVLGIRLRARSGFGRYTELS